MLRRQRRADDAARLLRQREDAAGVADQALAFARERHAPSLAKQQRRSREILELADLLADRRLRPVHPLAGTGEAPGIDDRDEGFQEIEIEHGAPRSRHSIIECITSEH